MHEQNLKDSSKGWETATPFKTDVPPEGLFTILWRRRRIILLAIMLCLAAAWGYLQVVKPAYTSTSRLYVEQTGPKIITDSTGVMTQSKNYLFTQRELLKSTPILSEALGKRGVRQMRIFENVDNPIVHLKTNLDVQVGKKDDLISISFDAEDPEESARLVNNVVDAYVSYHAQQKRSTAGTVLNILQNEKTRQDAELTAKLDAMLKFKQTNGALLFEDSKGNIIIQSLARLSEALTEAQLEKIEAKAALEAAKVTLNDPQKVWELIEARNPGGRSAAFYDRDANLRADINRMETRLIALKTEYTSDHPVVRTIRDKIDHLKTQLTAREKDLVEAYLAFSHEQEAVAKRKEAQIQAMFENQQQKAQDVNLKAAQFMVLQSDLTRTERLCDILDSRIKELNVTENTGALNINVLETARMEAEPTSPKIGRTIVTAIAGGLALGVFMGLVRNQTDKRFHSAVEISSVLDIPILGSVPRVRGKQSPFTRGQAVALEPVSHIAEAYRTIRTATYFSVPDEQTGTLLITSPVQGDGKTTLVGNLAIAVALAGKRTLVIDADFRKPMQHKVFGVPLEPGLVDVLSGDKSLDEVILQTAIDDLDILTVGSIPQNPSELLNSSAFARILDELPQRYDRILLDSPPVIPVTDSSILAARCDATILVLKAGTSKRKVAQEACNKLLGVGATILGAVVNAVPRGEDRYGYYGYKYEYRQKAAA
jgi:capsular exopolysaccharide synthesis family protein